jgi:1,4-dihydroxy-6-naphthoate synthase
VKLTLGFSPCPNDCFIFDALVHKKIDMEGLDVEVIMEDVETLNHFSFEEKLDITKLSFHAFLYAQKQYILLKSGSALGFNCGPLLITNSEAVLKSFNSQLSAPDSSLSTTSVAIPGTYTTANFLLSLAFPQLKNKTEMLFSEIEQAVLDRRVDAGLIIHENRFTYRQKGLKKIMDLGEFWEGLIHAPIPLGGIVARRKFDPELLQKINRCIRKSVEYAFANPEDVMSYVKQHGQEMDENVMKQHIDLYVNDFSIDLGTKGKEAVTILFNKALEQKLISEIVQPISIS